MAILTCTSCALTWAEDIAIVDWDGSGTEAQVDLDPDGVVKKVTDSAYNFGFDEQTIWAPKESYFPPPEKTGPFGLALSSSVGTGPGAPHIMRLDRRGASGGTLTILIQGTEDMPPQMRGLLFFLKENFLNGGAETGSKVHFDETSRFFFTGILDGKAPEARWLVRDGESWYVSEEKLTPQAVYNVSEPRELINPEATRWAEYNVQGIPLEDPALQFESKKFENITAAGIYWDSYGVRATVGGTSISRMAVDAFSVQAVK